MIDIWLEQLGVRAAQARGAAAGWGGDRMTVARGPDGQWAMAWRLAWDSPGEASQFMDAQRALSGLPFATRAVRIDQRTTVVLHASSPAILGRLAAG
jgi:hypothetical protein